ncbi:MAG: hypothetical protein GXP54_09215, partial [Deltaproteobacteria bacterium]|nr:hypothetical protein [Deltaproteobacteria bacterium]
VTPLISKLNEKLLTEVAEKTGGKYLSLNGVGTVAGQLKADLDAVEKAEYRSRVEKLLEDRFQYPLAAGLVLMLVPILLLGGRFGRTLTVLLAGFVVMSSQAGAKGILEKDDGDVDAALELFHKGRFGDAVKALEEIEAKMPARPDLLYDIALSKDSAGDHDAAIEAIDKALGIVSQAKKPRPDWPSKARLLYAKGTILGHKALKEDKEKKPPMEVRGIWRQAVEALTEAIVADPESDDTRRNLELAAMAAYPSCRKLDDPHEPNNTANEAKFLKPDPNSMEVKENLLLCPGDLDFFKLPVNPGETLIAGVTKPPNGSEKAAAGPDNNQPQPARVDITLTDQDGQVLSPRGKQVRFMARNQGTYIMKIQGPDKEEEDGIPYVLDARVIPPCPAGDDAMEDNDSREASKPIEDGQHSFRVCPSDDDWFAYTEKKGTQKQVTLQVPEGEGPLALEVFSADGSPLDVNTESGEKGSQSGAVFPKAEQDAPFYIRVFGGGGQGFYSLVIKDPKGNGNQQQNQNQPQSQQQKQDKQQQAGSQTMRELLDSIDRNEENLEAEEASRNFPYRDHVPEKDW